MDQPEAAELEDVPQETIYVADFTRVDDRPIAVLEPVDEAGWTHSFFVSAKYRDGNRTAAVYKVHKDGRARINVKIVLGPDDRIESADNAKDDGGLIYWTADGTAYISLWGHTTVGSGYHTEAIPGAWRFWPDIPEGQQTFTDVAPGSPFYRHVERAAAAGFINGYTAPDGSKQFRPGNSVTRGQAAAIRVGPIDG